MVQATIGALEAAARAGTLDTWLAALPTRARAAVERAIELDRPLWSEYPSSLASCLMARTLALADLADLHRAWTRELDARDAPWIAALRPLPVEAALLAERHTDDLAAHGQRLAFVSDAEVVLGEARWAWATGEVTYGERGGPGRRDDLYPRFTKDGWGPVSMIRAPGAAPVELPCPDEASAYGELSADGAHVFVHGTLDEYDGGFFHVLDLKTLAIERTLWTKRPVSHVHECGRRDLFLVETYGGLVVWQGEQELALPLHPDAACLSPSGGYLATLDGSLRVWSVEGLLAHAGEHRTAGIPTCFDPSGERLVSGRALFDGRTGRRVAELGVQHGQYLMGGPAAPWYHVGARYLVCTHGRAQVWDVRTGEPMPVGSLVRRFSSWSLAYDRAGGRVAVHFGHAAGVALHAVPSGRVDGELTFGLEGRAIAMSPDGAWIAMQAGPLVEVRTAAGALHRRFAGPGAPDDDERCEPAAERGRGDAARTLFQPETLRFSEDAARIAWFVRDDGWRIAALDGPEGQALAHVAADRPLDDEADFAAPWPSGWTLEESSRSVFTHVASGTQIALPVRGPWVSNPAAPRILASDGLHIELRGNR